MTVDVAKYNQIRVSKIVRYALSLAQDVAKTKKEKKIGPYNSYERRKNTFSFKEKI